MPLCRHDCDLPVVDVTGLDQNYLSRPYNYTNACDVDVILYNNRKFDLSTSFLTCPKKTLSIADFLIHYPRSVNVNIILWIKFNFTCSQLVSIGLNNYWSWYYVFLKNDNNMIKYHIVQDVFLIFKYIDYNDRIPKTLCCNVCVLVTVFRVHVLRVRNICWMSKARGEIMLVYILMCACAGPRVRAPVLARVCVALQPKSALGRLFLEVMHPVGLLNKWSACRRRSYLHKGR
jgi:hypothetical protein